VEETTAAQRRPSLQVINRRTAFILMLKHLTRVILNLVT